MRPRLRESGGRNRRTGNLRDKLEAWMEDETWFTAEAAVQHGFADGVTQEQKVAASFNLLNHYRNVPAALRKPQAVQQPVRRDINVVRVQQMYERLRTAGATA